MLLWKSVLLLFTVINISSPGLIILSLNYFLQQPPSAISNELKSDEKKLSKSFYQIERSIRNENYDRTAIPKKISDLTSKFEREYLQSLIKKREENFTSQYNLLVWQLNYVPELYRYYDELVFSAQANGKLNELKEQSSRLKTKNAFRIYISALIENALGNYESTLKILSEINKPTKEIRFLKAQSLRGLGNYEQAFSELNEAEKLSASDKGYLAKIYNSKGSLLFLSGQVKKADDLYKKALQTARSAGVREEESKALINLGIIADENGDVQSARRIIQQALVIINRIQNPDLRAFAYSELGVSYSLTSEIIEAKDHYEKSYNLYSKLNNKERLSYLSSNIAAIYGQLSNYKAALKHYEEGLDFAGDNKRGQILNFIGIGDVYANLANYSRALEYYEKAKEISAEIKDVNSSVDVDVSIGTLLYNIGRPHQAIDIFNKAAEIFDYQTNPYTAADLYFKTGLAYTDIDSLQMGLNYYQKGLVLAQSSGDIYNEILITTELAHNLYLANDFKKAEDLLNKIKIKSRQYGLTQLGNVQDLYLAKIFISKNENLKAAPLLKKVFNTSTSISDYNTQIEAGYLLAQLSEIQNNSEEADVFYKQTIKLIDELSKPLFGNSEIQIFRFVSLSEVYIAYVEFLYKLGKEEDAFHVVEQSRSRNTLQNLNNIKINSAINDESILNKLYDLDWMIKSGLYSGVQLSKIKTEYDQIKNKIISADPSLNKYINNLFGFPNPNLPGKLSEKENFITINLGKESAQIFHLRKNQLTSKRIGLSREEIKSMLGEIAPIYSDNTEGRDVYYNQDLFSFNAQVSYQLYKKLFEPVLSEISVGELIIFCLPSELAFLPAEFLVTEYDDKGSPYYYQDKKFLIDDYPVLYAPSLSVYLHQKEKELTQNKTVLLIGDPQFDNKDFALSYRGSLLGEDSFNSRSLLLFPLRYSKDEINNVNKLIENGYILISNNATEANFKSNAEESKIIHLSTHSFLHKEQPLILFSQNDESDEDGYLESAEILDLQLNSELVVLSSCKSGLGRIDRAEGILGMQKSFFEAGAKSIIVSLWDVNDKYTSYFMESFYKFLSEGNDKAVSLQKAKIYFKEHYSANPYYWSAFILAGDPSSIELQKASSGILLWIILLLAASAFTYFLFKRKRKTE